MMTFKKGRKWYAVTRTDRRLGMLESGGVMGAVYKVRIEDMDRETAGAFAGDMEAAIAYMLYSHDDALVVVRRGTIMG